MKTNKRRQKGITTASDGPLLQAATEHNKILSKGQKVDFNSLATRWSKGDPAINQALARVDQKFSSKPGTRRKQNRDLFMFDAGKLGKTPNELSAMLIEMAGNNRARRQQVLELIAIDDFMSVIGSAVPLIQKYGGQALDWFYKKYVRGNSDLLDSAVDYFLPDRYEQPIKSLTATNNPVAGIQSNPRMAITESRQISNIGANKSFSLSQYSLDSVCKEAVCAWLCPEVYAARLCDQYQIDASSLLKSEARLAVVTDANGNAGIYVNPHAWFAGATVNNWFDLTTINYGTTPFVPSTGVYNSTLSTGYTIGASPLYQSSSQIMRDALGVGFSLRFVPVVSDLNNGGFLEYAQFKTIVNTSFNTGTPTVTLVEVQNNPYYTFTNMKAEQRHIWIPSDVSDFQYAEYNSLSAAGTNPYNDMFYFVFQGCYPSSTIGEIIISDVRQYHASPLLNMFIQAEQAQPGPATRQLIAALVKAAPTVECLTLDEAKSLCVAIMHSDGKFDSILRTIVYVIEGKTTPFDNDMRKRLTTQDVLTGQKLNDEQYAQHWAGTEAYSPAISELQPMGSNNFTTMGE
jgi:hypothetical protein